MIYSNERIKLRQMFFDCWAKHQQNQPLEPLEKQLLDIILAHPEYHFLFKKPEMYLDKDFLPDAGETNPFLHMSMHMSIREQLATNRPQGICRLYQLQLSKQQDPHSVEHSFMELFAEMMWQAQRAGQAPDEQHYLKLLSAHFDTAGSH